MTKKSSRPNQQVGVLKALMLTGSVIATLAGTRLLAQQDSAVEMDMAVNEPLTVIVPTEDVVSIPLPPTHRGTQVHLAPIPQVVQPQIRPVARSRSSR